MSPNNYRSSKKLNIKLMLFFYYIANIDAEIIVIDSLLNDGDIINSNNKIKNVNEISLRINGELNDAISKVKK